MNAQVSYSPAWQPFHGTAPHEEDTTLAQLTRLRLLSFNIQVGIASTRLRHYLTHSWRHVLPHSRSLENLDRIANLINEFDIVALQEVDAGSFRSQHVNQVEYLSMRGHFPYWYTQTNRDLGRIARHSNGLLSRVNPNRILDHKLPGFVPGRGAIEVHFGTPGAELVLIIVHLGLAKRARLRQLRYLGEIINRYPHVIIMGDFNCTADSRELGDLLLSTSLCEPLDALHTYPSWRPIHNIDHILVTPSIEVEQIRVLDQTLSDHLPIMVEVSVPEALQEQWQNGG